MTLKIVTETCLVMTLGRAEKEGKRKCQAWRLTQFEKQTRPLSLARYLSRRVQCKSYSLKEDTVPIAWRFKTISELWIGQRRYSERMYTQCLLSQGEDSIFCERRIPHSNGHFLPHWTGLTGDWHPTCLLPSFKYCVRVTETIYKTDS